MNRRLMYGVVVVAGAMLGSGCSSSNSSSSSSDGGGSTQFGVSPPGDLLSSSAGASGTVWKVKWYVGTANENGDLGQKVTVHVGDSVIWVSTDAMTHDVAASTSNVPSPFPSAENATDFTTESTPIAFATAGSWGYYCAIHTATLMNGTITVQ